MKEMSSVLFNTLLLGHILPFECKTVLSAIRLFSTLGGHEIYIVQRYGDTDFRGTYLRPPNIWPHFSCPLRPLILTWGLQWILMDLAHIYVSLKEMCVSVIFNDICLIFQCLNLYFTSDRMKEKHCKRN